jgi:hypothetical protein
MRILVTSNKHKWYDHVGIVTHYDGYSGFGEFTVIFDDTLTPYRVGERECKIVGWADEETKAKA